MKEFTVAAGAWISSARGFVYMREAAINAMMHKH